MESGKKRLPQCRTTHPPAACTFSSGRGILSERDPGGELVTFYSICSHGKFNFNTELPDPPLSYTVPPSSFFVFSIPFFSTPTAVPACTLPFPYTVLSLVVLRVPLPLGSTPTTTSHKTSCLFRLSSHHFPSSFFLFSAHLSSTPTPVRGCARHAYYRICSSLLPWVLASYVRQRRNVQQEEDLSVLGRERSTWSGVWRRLEALKKNRKLITGLSFEDREHLLNMEIAMDVDNDPPFPLPPGEEGIFLSNAGGEVEFCHEIFQIPGASAKSKRPDNRTRWDRTSVRNKEWEEQMEELIDGYMRWRAGLRGEGTAAGARWEMFVIDFFGTSTTWFTSSSVSERTNVTLAIGGYLGTAPRHPTVAVSFQVLEAYRQLHRVCPRLSIQGIVRALCYLHLVPYSRTLVDQFSISFDVYLDILRGIDKRADVILRRDTPNWKSQNACAPCLYVLEGEAPLKYSLLATMDGNQSLKLVDDIFRSGAPRDDNRVGHSELWLSPEEVDRFKDEVRNAKAKKKANSSTAASSATPADNEHDDEHVAEELEDADEPLSICVGRWRNAGPEARKKMFRLFAATGIFVCICRHGQLLVACDMIRSGELMKYPLAVVDRLIEMYGPNVKLGYDIWCAFSKTLATSSLNDRALAACFSGVVPAFHGHSHNRGCQVLWHPMYMEGAGKEDFEGCERLFSESNALASGTRLATPFHRRQAIEQFFTFWGEQKHAESGRFIFNNYRQALDIIRDGSLELDVFSRELKTGPTEYEEYLVQEREHLRSLKAEPPEVVRKVEYMHALGQLRDAQVKAAAAEANWKQRDTLIIRDGIRGQQITRIQTLYRTTGERLRRCEEQVRSIEEELDIPVRWSIGMPEYEMMAVELRMRNYRLALDNLERLVVQRMFELTKLGMSGLGYKLREKIGKALKARAEAIKNALTEYNRCAAALSPPRPQIAWGDLMEMASLAEFDILRDARHDIRMLPWAQRQNRQAMNTYFNVKRAREEIERLNVEISRLFTAMLDEHADFQRGISESRASNPALAHELLLRWRYRDRLNGKVAEWLYKTSQLPGFTGNVQNGRRVGRSAALAGDKIPLPSWAVSHIRDSDCDAEDEAEDAQVMIQGVETDEDVQHLVDFFDGLGIEAPRSESPN
ncbi:hypothetical protein A0H81_06337 [Grifola frondosa]|uniref:CxC1-like cysteine cluster associated with KDZ transposases domain-containing protein n=1 Tax=Grifola frondosa TaxID=5627 RepID=A0A1C7MB74_GRIFR|nr:hypothetical protein A0H81_06337 [Grifola frondosa]